MKNKINVEVGRKQYYPNKYNIKIVKCCASCSHKEFDKGCIRICKHMGMLVKSNGLCGDWNIRTELDRAGACGGRVKKKHYLEYLADHEYKGTMQLKELRAEYEKKYGSIYINN